jgi:hypothetical protein
MKTDPILEELRRLASEQERRRAQMAQPALREQPPPGAESD